MEGQVGGIESVVGKEKQQLLAARNSCEQWQQQDLVADI